MSFLRSVLLSGTISVSIQLIQGEIK